MAHVEKFSKSAIGNMLKHYERSAKNYSNENIDANKTHMNYNLAEKRDISQVEFIHQRLENVKCLKRNDVKIMCDWVVTAPKDLEKTELPKFFEETYKFLENKYKVENVISSYVHLDEVTPHMHFSFMPIVLDKKKNIEKVSAKEVINRNELKSFHNELEKHLKSVGIECSILNEATKNCNKKVVELKKEEVEKQIKSLNAQIQALQPRTDVIVHTMGKGMLGYKTNEVEALKAKYQQLEKKNRILESKIYSTEQDLEYYKYQLKTEIHAKGYYLDDIAKVKDKLAKVENKLAGAEEKVEVFRSCLHHLEPNQEKLVALAKKKAKELKLELQKSKPVQRQKLIKQDIIR